jgi:hypothetical protein
MRMVEIIRCKCGNIFAACELGHHEDYEWKSDVQENLTKGCTVERISINDLEFKKCVCPSEKKEDKPTPEKKEEETQEESFEQFADELSESLDQLVNGLAKDGIAIEGFTKAWGVLGRYTTYKMNVEFDRQLDRK